MEETPYANSMFQLVNFTAGQETPERRYRHCSLQLHQKNKALKECEFSRRRVEIDIAELYEELEENKLSYSKFKIERLNIDIEEKEYTLECEEKIIKDCLFEVKVYENILKDLPVFTREEFEASEYGYWEKRLVNDAKREIISTGTVNTGTMSSLENIGVSITRNKEGKLAISGKESAVNLLKGKR